MNKWFSLLGSIAEVLKENVVLFLYVVCLFVFPGRGKMIILIRKRLGVKATAGAILKRQRKIIVAIAPCYSFLL